MIKSKLSIAIAAVTLLGLTAVSPIAQAQDSCGDCSKAKCCEVTKDCPKGSCETNGKCCDTKTACCDPKSGCCDDGKCCDSGTCCDSPAAPKGFIAMLMNVFK